MGYGKLNWEKSNRKNRDRATISGTRAKLENMSYGQTLTCKEQCQRTGPRGREAGGAGLWNGEREGTHDGTGSGGRAK